MSSAAAIDGQRPAWSFALWRAVIAFCIAWLLALVAFLPALLVNPADAVAERIVDGDGWPPFAGGSAGALAGNAGVAALLAALLAVALWLAAFAKDIRVPLLWTAVTGVATATACLLANGWLGLLVMTLIVRQLAFTAHGRTRPAPVADRSVAVALALLAVLGAGTVTIRAAADPLVLNPVYGDTVAGPLSTRASDHVPGPRVAWLSLRNLGPRSVRIVGVRPATHGGIRVVGARHEPGSWSAGEPALRPLQPFSIAPGADGELHVLLSDPACARRQSPVSLPVDVRRAGGTERVHVRVGRCR